MRRGSWRSSAYSWVGRSAAISWQVPPAASICSRAVLLKPCAWTVSALLSSPLREHLHRHVLARRQTLRLQCLERHRSAGLEARLEVGEVDRLGVGAERLERHRLLHVRPAQLAHPHVDRVLAALEAAPGAWRPSARPSPSGRGRRSCRCPSPRRGRRACAAGATRERASRLCSPIALGACARRRSSRLLGTSTRWRTLCSIPRICGVS